MAAATGYTLNLNYHTTVGNTEVTVTLDLFPPGSTHAGLAVTISDNSSRGDFYASSSSSATATLTTAAPTWTTKYVARQPGVIKLSCTNNGGLPNAPPQLLTIQPPHYVTLISPVPSNINMAGGYQINVWGYLPDTGAWGLIVPPQYGATFGSIGNQIQAKVNVPRLADGSQTVFPEWNVYGQGVFQGKQIEIVPATGDYTLSEIAGAVVARLVDDDLSLVHVLRGISAALVGNLDASQNGKALLKNLTNRKTRIDANVFQGGTRTISTIDLK